MKYGEYIWQSPHWPNWQYDLASLTEPLVATSHAQGLLFGRLADVGMNLRDEASLAALTQDVVQTSAIEGETLPCTHSTTVMAGLPAPLATCY